MLGSTLWKAVMIILVLPKIISKKHCCLTHILAPHVIFLKAITEGTYNYLQVHKYTNKELWVFFILNYCVDIAAF